MEEKEWAIIEELEKLTQENAANFLAPYMHGQAKVKGKYIRDENGKLIPVLVRTKRQAPPFNSGRCIRTERQKPEEFGVIKKFIKLFLSAFTKQR